MSVLIGKPKPAIPDMSEKTWIWVTQGPKGCEFWIISRGKCWQAFNRIFDPPGGVDRQFYNIAKRSNIGYESLLICEKTLDDWPADDPEGPEFCKYCRAETYVIPLASHDEFMEMIEVMKKKAIKPVQPPDERYWELSF